MESSTFEVIKGGWIEKRSRFVKKWRRRYLILTPKTLETYKEENISDSAPTERIPLDQTTTVKSAEEETKREFAFKVETRERIFYFCTSDVSDKETWIGVIGRAMVKPSVLRSKSEEDALNGIS